MRLERKILGLSRADASRRAGVALSTWARLESGSPSVTLATIAAATDAVGLDLVCQTYPGGGPSLRDRGQLEIAQRLAAIASPLWRVSLEELAGDHREAVDQVFTSPSEIIAIEIERMLDFQAQFRRASLKRDWLARHTSLPVRLVIVVEDTRANRSALAPHLALIGGVLPNGSRALIRSLRTGAPLGGDGLCWIRRSPTASIRR